MHRPGVSSKLVQQCMVQIFYQLSGNIPYTRYHSLTWLTPLIITLFVLLNGCTQAPEPPLNVGTNQWPGYEPLYLARSLGYYGDRPVRLVELPSATEVIHAVRNGSLDAAALTLDETLSLLADQVELRVVQVLDFSNGADVLLAKPAYTSMSSLRGKRIGVENTAVGAIILKCALAAADMSLSDIRIVPVTVDEHEQAYLDDRVDALATFEPVRSRLLARGARKLFDSSAIPERIVDVLVVKNRHFSASQRP